MKSPSPLVSPVAEPPIHGLDALAILLSGLCLLHCLALPVVVAALPLAASSLFADERFHQWLLLGAVPTSIFALGWGWRRHRDRPVALLGAAGMLLMIVAAVGVASGWIEAAGERGLTIVGAVLLALAHARNYRLRDHVCDLRHPHRH